ncbi:MAG: Crp/Fnr family transcriptional regulator [Flavobacteriales bacterium]|nr:Crp/Fnr family transcriptional regulator [Flavobacteriales bacterium]MCC6937039.1 Crp/Fnr family transcriptional regulator [Flavobacteriales bacterium]
MANHSFRLNDLIEQYCAPEWRELMNSRNTRNTYRKGEAIFKQGEVADKMYMIEQGRIKVVASYVEGRDRIVRLAADGEVLGHRGIGTNLIYTANVIALSETEVNIIPMSLFLSVLKANNLFCYHFLLFFVDELRVLDQQARDILNMTVTQRVVKALRMNMDAFGFDERDKKRLAFTISRKEIAQIADTTYESVIRSLAELQQQGLIVLTGKQIRILKKKELLALLNG